MRKEKKPASGLRSPATIGINNPPELANISLPYPANGLITLGPGEIRDGVYYQINAGALKPVQYSTDYYWSTTLTTSDCPTLGSYTLTVYLAYHIGANSYTAVGGPRHFTRIS